ncbi:hypothetical protein ACIQ6K_39715, partial [Streptomyces sp. NPDC096354]|uniref:hypothetical protein n=1 Tax=Streptomyces sp. NPDC096354 TaxID=3366088 RepID=UPI003815AA48
RFMARPNSTSEDRPVESLTSLSMLDTITGAFYVEGAFNVALARSREKPHEQQDRLGRALRPPEFDAELPLYASDEASHGPRLMGNAAHKTCR